MAKEWKRRKFKVSLLKYVEKDDLGWTTIEKKRMNIYEVLDYFMKTISQHDNIEADGDNIESLMWEENGETYSLVVGDPNERDI